MLWGFRGTCRKEEECFAVTDVMAACFISVNSRKCMACACIFSSNKIKAGMQIRSYTLSPVLENLLLLTLECEGRY